MKTYKFDDSVGSEEAELLVQPSRAEQGGACLTVVDDPFSAVVFLSRKQVKVLRRVLKSIREEDYTCQ